MTTNPKVKDVKDPAGASAVADIDVPGVVIDTSKGEYLHFELTAEGANMAYNFGCEHRIVRTADVTHPKGKDTWDWFDRASDADSNDDGYTITLLFVATRKYRYYVEHRHSDETLVKVLKDRTYESDDPRHVVQNGLVVVIREVKA